jgi:hypothetical protein
LEGARLGEKYRMRIFTFVLRRNRNGSPRIWSVAYVATAERFLDSGDFL